MDIIRLSAPHRSLGLAGVVTLGLLALPLLTGTASANDRSGQVLVIPAGSSGAVTADRSGGADDPPGHDANDDNGADPAGHDANDDNGVDPAGHDANDDNGGANGNSGSANGGSNSGQGGSDDHGGASGNSGGSNSGQGGSDDHGGSSGGGNSGGQN